MGWEMQGRGDDEGSPPPRDVGNLAYIIYFALGVGLLLPWNSSITAVDYFSYLYPEHHVDRVFSVAYLLPCLVLLCFLTFFGQGISSWVRVNVGLSLSLLSVIVIPAIDVGFIDVQRGGSKATYYVTVGMLVLQGLADATAQGSLVGALGKLPGRYLQAFVSGTSASAVLVAICRISTKAAFPRSPRGLRLSGIVYFAVSATFLGCCLVCFNLLPKLPVVNHYHQRLEVRRSKPVSSAETKPLLTSEDVEGESAAIELPSRRSTLDKDSFEHILGKIKWPIVAMILIYVVSLSIFPGFLAEDVHSAALGDWYPVLLLSSYSLFDLVGRGLALPEVCIPNRVSVLVAGAFGRLLFIPLFYACLHGPKIFRSEVPVCVLTWLLGASNGYLTTCLFVVSTQLVPLAEAEAAGIIITLALVLGLAIGSSVGFLWVI